MKPDLTRRPRVLSSLESGAASAAIRDALASRRARNLEPVSAGWKSVGLGARMSLRIWGTWGPRGHRRWPMIVSWMATPAGQGSDVDIVMTNDEGTYLIYPEFGLRKFERHLDEVESALRSSL